MTDRHGVIAAWARIGVCSLRPHRARWDGIRVEPARELGTEDAQRLASTLARVAVEMHGHRSRKETVNTIMRTAVETIPGAEVAGITLVEGSRLTSDAHTDELASTLDAIQSELGQGPCLYALRHEPVVGTPDMTDEQRWPKFAQRAADMGIMSALSFQMFLRADALGALNLFAYQPNAFREEDEVIGQLLAQHAAVAYAEATRHYHLGVALENRDLIGQAKGILMQRDNLTAAAAFDLLSRASQDTNLKLADVARWLVEETERTASDTTPE